MKRCALLTLLVLLVPTLIWAQEATPEPEVMPEMETTTLPEGVELIVVELPLLGLYEHVVLLEAGDVLSVIAHDPTGAADPTIALVNPSGEVVAENDNHETEIDALDANSAVLDAIVIDEDGEYAVRVDNNFYEAGVVDLYIIANETTVLANLFPDRGENLTPTPQVQLQERPQIRTTGPCTASVDFIAARLREAPTANAPQVASLFPGISYAITGKVRGADNYTWYRLENYLWVRADAVLAAGACGNVPTF